MTNKDKFADKDSLGYNMQIIGRNVLVTEAMKQYAMDKLSKIEKFHNHIMDFHVVMDIEHLEHTVTIVVKFDHFRVKAHAKSLDMYASVDLAMDRLQAQLRRWKDKIQDHSQKKLSVVDMEVNVLEGPFSDVDEFNAEIEAQNAEKRSKEMGVPKIRGRKTVPLKTLNTEEAIMKMELSNDQFLIYRAEEDKKLKVIYRRKDGNYGIVQPE